MDLAGLAQSQVDLELSTREKLVNELDKYYDYRKLKVMDLSELMALSAKTRGKLETDTLEEIAETAEETAEREKDAKVSVLEAIEEAYKKESALIDKKIKLLEVEIRILEARHLMAIGQWKEARLMREAALQDLEKLIGAEEAVGEAGQEAFKKVGEELQISIGVLERFNTRLGKIPKTIKFDVIGKLKIPEIPTIGPQQFNIVGRYQAPEIPSYQHGTPYIPRTQVAVLHKGEAVIPAGQNRAGAGGGNTFNVRIFHTGDIRSEMDENKFVRKIADKIKNDMERV